MHPVIFIIFQCYAYALGSNTAVKLKHLAITRLDQNYDTDRRLCVMVRQI